MPSIQANILIVEDEPMIAEMYQTRFSMAGHKVWWAPNGAEGIKMLSQEKPDLLLLDIIMPKINGYDVLNYVRSNEKIADLLVCMISNLEQIKEVREGLSAGADYYFTKSKYTPGELLERINKIIELYIAPKKKKLN